MNDFPFCGIAEVVLRNDLAFARFDKYPVNPGHLLILPWRHVATWFEATDVDQAALMALVAESKRLLDENSNRRATTSASMSARRQGKP